MSPGFNRRRYSYSLYQHSFRAQGPILGTHSFRNATSESQHVTLCCSRQGRTRPQVLEVPECPRVSPPLPPAPWPLPVEPCQRGLLLSPQAPGCEFLFIILSLSAPLSLRPGLPTVVTHRNTGKVWAQEVGSCVPSPRGEGELRSVGCHGNTTVPAPGAAGFQEGASALLPRGHPTLALRSFLPSLMKYCFRANCLPGSEVLATDDADKVPALGEPVFCSRDGTKTNQ